MDHTVLGLGLPAHTPFLPLTHKRSPESATTNCGSRHQLQLAAHLSTPSGRKAELAWLAVMAGLQQTV